MATCIKKYARLMLIVLLAGAIMLPASAYASPRAAEDKYHSSDATSFLSSLTHVLASWFGKEERASYGGSKTSGNWLSWLKGKDGGSGQDWWEDNKHDSYKLWEKYYCY